ncbi:MAG: major capsid protein [Treponema sp.]|nr:major capsid protein [Treponema sp.]
MINILTKVIALFHNQPDITKMGFLSSFFHVGQDSFTDAEYADLDEIYEGEDIAPAVTDLSTGAVLLVDDKFNNKQIPFPVYAMKSPAQIAALMNRQPGESAYVTQKVTWLARLANILVRKLGRMTNMIRRSMEQQAAQVLQTGDIVLTDEKGNQAFKLGLEPSMSHFPTVLIPWSDEDADPMGDIDLLADTIRNEGLVDVENLIFGNKAWINFIKNEWVQENLKKEGLATGELSPQIRDKGGKYMGYVDYAANRYYFWTYNARYNLFKEKEKIKYIDDDNVIFLPNPESIDFRRIFGGIPTVTMNDTFEQLFGADKVQIGNEYDIRPRVWWSDDNEAYIVEVKSRPLMLPVSVKRYGCLKTNIAA